MHDEVILTKEEYKDFIVAKEKLKLLDSIIANSITVRPDNNLIFSDYAFLKALELIGYRKFDKIWESIRHQKVQQLIEQEKENDDE